LLLLIKLMKAMITFDELPKTVSEIQEKVNSIERLLAKNNNEPKTDNDLLTVGECAKYLQLAKPTIYNLISRGELPVMKRSKRCYFSKAELYNYLRAGRKKTVSEIEDEADDQLSKN